MSQPQRVVSLIASATEIVAALGRLDRLVGRSHECDHPPGVRSLPACSRPGFKPDVPGREIDRSVRLLLEQHLSVYQIDAERLRELRPDVILTQDQCEVCAVSLRDVERAAGDWIGEGVQVVSLRTESLGDLWRDIARIARVLGAGDRLRELVGGMQRRMREVAAIAQVLDSRPRVAAIEWIDPLMGSGNWMPEMIELAGGVNLFGETGLRSPWLNWDDFCAANPDVILVSPCGFDVKRTEQEMHHLTERGGWSELDAVRGGRVYLADGNAYFHRPGPRLLDSVEILAEILHPEAFARRYPETAWKT